MKAWVLVALTVCTLLVTSWHLFAAVGVDERVLAATGDTGDLRGS